MLEVAYMREDKQGSTEAVRDNFIPRLCDVRRVPVRYQHMLPLAVTKRYQCVVLGASARTLTVGVVDCKNRRLLDLLHALTGAAIFPVLVDAQRMHLLIARMERDLCPQRRYNRAYAVRGLPGQVRLQLLFREQRAASMRG